MAFGCALAVTIKLLTVARGVVKLNRLLLTDVQA